MESERLGGIISVCSSCSTILDANPYSHLLLEVRGKEARQRKQFELIIHGCSTGSSSSARGSPFVGLNIFLVPTGLALTVDCIPLERESIVVVPISQLSGGMVKGLTARGHKGIPPIFV